MSLTRKMMFSFVILVLKDKMNDLITLFIENLLKAVHPHKSIKRFHFNKNDITSSLNEM